MQDPDEFANYRRATCVYYLFKLPCAMIPSPRLDMIYAIHSFVSATGHDRPIPASQRNLSGHVLLLGISAPFAISLRVETLPSRHSGARRRAVKWKLPTPAAQFNFCCLRLLMPLYLLLLPP